MGWHNGAVVVKQCVALRAQLFGGVGVVVSVARVGMHPVCAEHALVQARGVGGPRVARHDAVIALWTLGRLAVSVVATR